MGNGTAAASRPRLDSIDALRGLVIVLMALDHCRDFFGPASFSPENLERTSVALFATRWVTHFCAPVFVFLAGLGAALYAQRGRSRGEVARFLLTRGLLLIALELTVVNLSWLSFFVGYVFVQVIWVLGWSMVILAGLLWLPRAVTLVASLAMVFGHNLLDGIAPSDFGSLDWAWGLVHAFHWEPLGESFGLMVLYPLLPWPGVMALGYLAGDLYKLEPNVRNRRLARLGLAATAAFLLLRATNLYGDPSPWAVQEKGALFTVLSFLNTTKYPASLLFLLMTLGPALWLLSRLDRPFGRPLGQWMNALVTYGRAPLFFYLLHFPVIHLAAALHTRLRFDTWWAAIPQRWQNYEPSLVPVYLAWIGVVVLLYPVCRWFGRYKRTSRAGWVRYL